MENLTENSLLKRLLQRFRLILIQKPNKMSTSATVLYVAPRTALWQPPPPDRHYITRISYFGLSTHEEALCSPLSASEDAEVIGPGGSSTSF